MGEYVSTQTLVIHQNQSYISSALNLIKARQHIGKSFIVGKKQPPHKLIEQQRSFFSTKRKRKERVRIKKITTKEKKEICTALLEKHTPLYSPKGKSSFSSLSMNTISKSTPLLHCLCIIHSIIIFHARNAALDVMSQKFRQTATKSLITVVPWKSGRLLVWDATCPDTFAPSYLPSTASGVGAVAAAAEERKKRKYSHLDQCHLFVPVAIETTGVFGPETMEFLRELGRRLHLVSADHNSTTYLIQRLSVVAQRGNAASVLGSAGNMDRYDFFAAP